MTAQYFKGKLQDFVIYLRCQEYAENSIGSYKKDLQRLIEFLGESSEDLEKEHFIKYKKTLSARLKPASVNRNIASVNKFLKYLGLDSFTLKGLRIQEQSTNDNALTEREFNELLQTAFGAGKAKIGLIMLTLACTGIRIGELRFVTVQAVESGKIVISSKGTVRTVVLHKELRQELVLYCRKNNIKSDTIFTGSLGTPISRSSVAGMMKDVAKKCGVDPRKVFPHNLRHYFARCFLDCGNPLSDLADYLGHKDINTTRRYLKTNTKATQRQLSRLKIIRNWRLSY